MKTQWASLILTASVAFTPTFAVADEKGKSKPAPATPQNPLAAMMAAMDQTNRAGNPSRDPTAPSDKIMEKLAPMLGEVAGSMGMAPAKSGKPAAAEGEEGGEEDEEVSKPALLLKAIVLSDKDHGMALIELGKRKVRLSLVRKAAGAAPTNERADTVTIDDIDYTVEDFSDHSLVLTSADKKLYLP